MLIFTSFITCRFYLIKWGWICLFVCLGEGGGCFGGSFCLFAFGEVVLGFISAWLHYFPGPFSHQALPCWCPGLQAHPHHISFEGRKHTSVSPKSSRCFQGSLPASPPVQAQGQRRSSLLSGTAGTSGSLWRLWVWALGCPCDPQTHWGSSSSSLSPATSESVGRLPVTQWIKQQWYFGDIHETTTEAALEVDYAVESDQTFAFPFWAQCWIDGTKHLYGLSGSTRCGYVVGMG